MPKLKDVPLDKTISEEEYKLQLRLLQEKLGHLHNRLYRKRVPVVIVYEGLGRCRKGWQHQTPYGGPGPPGFEVHPIASPEPKEKARHYLWRFWTRLPPRTATLPFSTAAGTAG